MTRVHVQLTDEQAARLRRLAARSGVSVPEFVRRGVASLLHEDSPGAADHRHPRARSAVGRFHSGRRHVAEEHDAELDVAVGA